MTNNARGAEGPNLLIVGFLKCGTTSLAKYLSDHPDVASPVAKELYYLIDPHSNLVSMQPVIGKLSFGKTGIDGRIPKYADFFSEIFEKKYAMDATPFYYSQQRALKYAENNPDTKIIFMMRSPEKRILSSFRFFQSMYQEYPASSFSEFVDALLGGEEQKKNYRKRIKKAFFRELFDDELKMGSYKNHIEKWVSAIGRERIFLGTMEELRDNSFGFMERICRFLQIDQNYYMEYDFSPYMQSYQVRFPILQKIGRRFGKEDPMRYDTISRFQSPFHRLSIPGLRNGLDRIYRRLQHMHVLNANEMESLEKLAAHYEPFNAELRENFGIDYTNSNKSTDFDNKNPPHRRIAPAAEALEGASDVN